MALKAGDIAPDFALPDQDGTLVRLADFAGKQLVLYFYPKDDTPGCTIESQQFSALSSEFAAKGIAVYGVSADSPAKHVKFRKKYDLAIPLLSDESTQMLDAYGVWAQKSMYGKTYMGIERTTVLIGTDGRIERVWDKVKVEGHAGEVLACLVG